MKKLKLISSLHFILIILSSISIAGCSNVAKPINLANEEQKLTFKKYSNLEENSKLTIADENEVGERLFVCGRIAKLEDSTLINGQRIYIYHATHEGEYEPSDPMDESTARLHGTLVSDSLGRFFVQTILPGDYGSGINNRHIHTIINGADPEAYDIHFDQYTTKMGRRFIKKSDQHFLPELFRLSSGNLVIFITIYLKRYENE